MVKTPGSYSLSVAQRHLSKVDTTMALLMKKVGPTKVRSEADSTLFESLARAIVYQMLSTKSAAAIHGRLVEGCGGVVTPEKIESLGESKLREIGFSRAKVASILDLAGKIQSGLIPADEVLTGMQDDELVACLTQVKGIGEWSVQMLMVFNLARADVFPATDLGVRRGHMLAYGLEEMLSAKQLLEASVVWKPYRTVATWYLWRATDSVVWS